VNVEDVRSKLEVLESNQRQLERLRAMDEAAFVGDVVYLDSALHRLQTSIQALLDIGAYIIGSLQMPAPRTSADIIRALAARGYLRAEDAEGYERMVAFRNRVVHLYNRIDPGIVYGILQEHVADLERLRGSLVAAITAHRDPET
jgi:uncharacterized protein YutE (UPF0331/DUF86 family)